MPLYNYQDKAPGAFSIQLIFAPNTEDLMIRKICICLLLALVSHVSLAQESFKVSDIKVKGLQRISAGSIFSYLPIKVGDDFDPSTSSDMIRELYKTGFFKNIELSTEGTAIIIDVIEYPSISQIEFAGNKLIKEESLRCLLYTSDAADE